MSRKRRRRRRRKQSQSKVGGLAFYMSLFVLIGLSVNNSLIIPSLWDADAFNHLWRFGLGAVVGGAIASLFITGHTHVLLHELKHAIVSNLVGNKWKGMKVKSETGHFQYSYTKSTAEYNAFISLAPYFLPIFALPALAISLALWWNNHQLAIIVVGVGYGIDLILNTRDISPVQSDLTEINGGYSIAVLYVLAINVALSTTLLAWVMQQSYGLKVLLYGLWQFCLHMVAYYRGL